MIALVFALLVASPDASPLPDGTKVEVSVEELQQLIGKPKPKPGLESAEAELAKAFEKEPESLFGAKAVGHRYGPRPKFIYYPVGADPMLTMWDRRREEAKALLAVAEAAVNAGDRQRALEAATRLCDEYPEFEGIGRAKDIRRVMEPASPVDCTIMRDGPIEPDLPYWVRRNATAAIVTENDAQVMIGSDMLRVGDSVPRYAGVTVVAIEPGSVTLTCQGVEYRVVIDGRQ